MLFTIETLYKTRKTGFLHREPTDEVAGYRIWRDGSMGIETYDAGDLRLAESRCAELNRDFGTATLDEINAEKSVIG